MDQRFLNLHWLYLLFQGSPRIRFNKEGSLLAATTNDNGIKVLANGDGMRLLRMLESRAFDLSRGQSDAKNAKVFFLLLEIFCLPTNLLQHLAFLPEKSSIWKHFELIVLILYVIPCYDAVWVFEYFLCAAFCNKFNHIGRCIGCSWRWSS